MKKFGKISRRTWTTISAVLVLIGIVMYAYPMIANLISQKYTDLTIESFEETVQSMQVREGAPTAATNPQGGNSPLDGLLKIL